MKIPIKNIHKHLLIIGGIVSNGLLIVLWIFLFLGIPVIGFYYSFLEGLIIAKSFGLPVLVGFIAGPLFFAACWAYIWEPHMLPVLIKISKTYEEK